MGRKSEQKQYQAERGCHSGGARFGLCSAFFLGNDITSGESTLPRPPSSTELERSSRSPVGAPGKAGETGQSESHL